MIISYTAVLLVQLLLLKKSLAVTCPDFTNLTGISPFPCVDPETVEGAGGLDPPSEISQSYRVSLAILVQIDWKITKLATKAAFNTGPSKVHQRNAGGPMMARF